MFIRLLLVFCTLPLLDLWLLLGLGARIGLLPTVLAVVGTGIAGAALAHRQGLSVLQSILQEMQQGQMPAGRMLEGAGLLVAGALLLTPGLLTDVLGLALLVPPLRRLLADRALRSLQRRALEGADPGGVITIHAVRLDADEPPQRHPPHLLD
jgi:UPF0716 protein FxsA